MEENKVNKCEVKKKIKLKPLYVLEGNWTKICNTMFKYIPNGNDFKIYCYLCYRYNEKYQYAFPSLSTIAEDTCLSISTVKRSLKWLEDKKYILRYKQKENNSEWKNNCYYVRYVEEDIQGVQKEIINNFENMMGEEFESTIIAEEVKEEEE